jgi:hypothetical protein
LEKENMGLTAEKKLLRQFRVMSLVAFSMLASSEVPAGEFDRPGVEGRWENANKDLVLDVRRCGERYCGRLVKSGDRCDRTVLTIVPSTTPPQITEPAFHGELALPDHPRIYKAWVTIMTAGMLEIVGNDEPSFVRRTFPFYALLTRTGDSRCRTNATS